LLQLKKLARGRRRLNTTTTNISITTRKTGNKLAKLPRESGGRLDFCLVPSLMVWRVRVDCYSFNHDDDEDEWADLM
jgi:hypothetical protein